MTRRKLTKAEREVVYQKFGGHCAYCGAEIAMSDMQVDHIQPLHRGGTNEIGNMYPACRSCNHYKHTLTVDEFRAYLQGIPDRLRRDSVAFQVGERFGIVSQAGLVIEFCFERRNGHEN